jgi:anti-anti-sigma regulatory factor
LSLDGQLTIATSGQIAQQFLEALSNRPEIDVDCTGATEIDVSFIQLLVATARSARAMGKQVTIVETALLREVLDRCGFPASTDGAWLSDADGAVGKGRAA